MRTYEALFIIQPEAAEDEVQTIVTEVESLITADGGTIVRSEVWGKRRLAYEVSGNSEGIYVMLRFQAPADSPRKLEAHFKLSEAVIRDIIVHFDEKTLKLEAEQLRRNEEMREQRAAAPSRDGDRDRDRDREETPRERAAEV